MLVKKKIKNIMKWNDIMDPITHEPIMPYKINCTLEEILDLLEKRDRTDHNQ